MESKSFFPAALLLGLASFPVLAADRWWDGGTADIGTNGDAASAGGAGTWNASLKNWDLGNALSHGAWDSAAGDTAIFGGSTAGTVTLPAGLSAGGLAIVNSSGTYTLSGSAVTLTGSSPVISVTRSGTISSKLSGSPANGVTKTGSATLTLNGTVANDFSGGLTVQTGTVILNLGNMATATDLIPAGSPLSLGSGILSVSAKSSGVSSQTVNGLVLNGGSAAGITFTSSVSASSSLNLGGITRNANAVLNFTLPATGSITTSAPNNARGILGTWASTGSSTGLKYATVSSNVVGSLTGTPAADAAALSDTSGNGNYDLTAATGSVPASVAVNTIRYIGAVAGTTAPGASLFSVNGLMNSGSGLWTIGSNDLSIGAERELVIHPGASGITVSGVIKDNAAGASALTIAGSAAVGLNTANTYSGPTTIHGTSAYADNGSTVTIANTLKDAGIVSEFGKGSVIALSGAVIQMTPNNASGTCNRGLILSGTSGFYLKSVLTQTLAGSISGSGNLSVDSDFAGTGTTGKGNLILAGDNSFTGDIAFQNDAKITLAHANALAKATLNLSGTRIMADLASNNFAYVIGALKGSVNLNLGTAKAGGGSGMVTVGGNHQSGIYSGTLSGAAGLTKAGNGTLSLNPATPNSYGGDTRVAGGVLAVNGSALPDSTKLVIDGGKVAPSGTETVDTLFFGALQQAAGTWGAPGSGADHIDDNRFSGSAGVVKVQPWSVNAAQLNFGQVTNGDTIAMSVTITNLGTTTISGTAAVVEPRFSVTGGASWSVGANSSTTVTVSFSPLVDGVQTGTLTLTGSGLTRTVALAGEGIPASQPLANQIQDYAFSTLPGMAAPASSAAITLNEGGTLTQSFKPRRDAFLGQFAARDSANVPLYCELRSLSFKTTAYQTSPSTLRFEIFRVQDNGSRLLQTTEDLDQTLFGDTPYQVTFQTPAVLDFDANYEMRLTLVTCGERSYGGGPSIKLFAPSSGYADGALASGGDLWFDGQGSTVIPVYPELVVTAAAGNCFFYDGDVANANSSSYDNLKGKLLGIGGAAEKLVFSHPAEWGPLSFSVDNTSFATATPDARSGNSDSCQLSGVAEGNAMLWVKAGGTVVGYMKLMTFPQRWMPLSYTYVQYPGESDHALKHASAEIMAYISSLYAKANIAIQWTDNGIITHEWDENGDGSSFNDTYSEIWSPMTSGALPNQSSYFSNVFMLRFNKDDNFLGGTNGGGTSMGLGPDDSPRGANVRCHLLRPASQFASTLSHEIGHNLGLYHQTVSNNLMTVGRAKDELWTWQWTTIHSTLKTLQYPAGNPDGNANGILDGWETQMFGGASAGANLPDADADGDGISNILEYAFGTHPLQPNANPVSVSLVTIGASRHLQVSVPKNPAAINLGFAAELSPELGTWTGAGITVEENSTTRFTAHETAPTGSVRARFIHVKVTVNP
ncbi:autotransporter-associated beta strand repeat-containing protein [Haloferula sp. BvORR071]|uniref:autotransporter-associated beta strand repeat-containing protein n=1 Tax=Haloferula sp. BvORR071 TaxID=1396141 RepID=UPI00055535DA|nr:autotransporter-associated beta strand repeat-containing protein [Haloferula sp. BvORR071]